MKIFTKLLTIITILGFVFTAKAEVQFLDTFDVASGGGLLNYDYLSRQSGTISPIEWYNQHGLLYVTNAGPNAGKAHFDPTLNSAYFGLTNNFTFDNMSIDYTITRIDPDNYYRLYWGSDARNDSQVFFCPNGVGGYQTWEAAPGFLSSFSDGDWPELMATTYSPKIVISGANSPAAHSALFINNKAYPMTDIGQSGVAFFTYTHQRTFVNNYVWNLYSRGGAPYQSANLDDFMISTPILDGSASTTSVPWDNDADSGISSSKSYTHAVNFLGDDVTVNGVTFVR